VLASVMAAVATALMSLIGAGQADAATIGLTPSFSAADLGEGATLTAKLTITGSEYHGSPAPLTDIALDLPAGTGVVREGFDTCPYLTLGNSGPSACPPGSQAGPIGETSFIDESEPGGGRKAEMGSVEAFFSPPGEEGFGLGADTEFYLYFLGPGSDNFIVPVQVAEDTAPYGHVLSIEVPYVETIPDQPFLSWTGITFNLGATREEEGSVVHSVTIPEECPISGKFPWAADVTLETTTHVHATAETTCPPPSSKRGTTTAVAASTASPTIGQSLTYTAIVTSKTPGIPEPSGTIRFLDGGSVIAGCSAQSLTPGSSSSTATCTLSYPSPGSHQISAQYKGDSNFFGSISSVQTITVNPVSEPPSTKQHEEEARKKAEGESASKKKSEEEALAAKRKQEAETAARKAAEEKMLAAVRSALAGILAPTGRTAKIGSLLKHGGLTTPFAAPEPGAVLIQWWQVPAGAHLSSKKTKAKPVLVAQGRMTFSVAGSSKVKIGLTSLGRRLLRHAKRLTLTAEAGFVPVGGAAVSETRAIVVRG